MSKHSFPGENKFNNCDGFKEITDHCNAFMLHAGTGNFEGQKTSLNDVQLHIIHLFLVIIATLARSHKVRTK